MNELMYFQKIHKILWRSRAKDAPNIGHTFRSEVYKETDQKINGLMFSPIGDHTDLDREFFNAYHSDQ